MKLKLNRWLALAASGLLAANSSAADIVDTAVGAGQFKTLAAALGAADLVGTLKGPGPFTVFAPSDDAFAKLPAGTVETLLKPENKGKLAGILTYHVVSGKVMAKQVVGIKGAVTVNGQRIEVSTKDGKVMVDGATVVTTDIQCDNGVIHVIDSVLMPPAKGANARQMLEKAVVQGSQLYNAGHHDACATVYQNAMNELMSSQIQPSIKNHMTSVLNSASQQQCPTERSWTLRRGIDQMYGQLSAND